MKTDNWISLGALAVAILALIVSFITFYNTSKTKKYELGAQYIKEMTDWHAKSVEVLIRMKLFLEGHVTSHKNELLSQLSSLIEIGRLYFPNAKKGNFGEQKPKIYRGFRNLMLDFLVFSYEIFESADPKASVHDNQGATEDLELLQRKFTSLFYEKVNPKEFLKEAKKYTGKEFYMESSYEDLMNSNDPSNTRFAKIVANRSKLSRERNMEIAKQIDSGVYFIIRLE